MPSSSSKDAEKISSPHLTSLGPFQSCLSLLTVFQLPRTFWPSSISSSVSSSPKDSFSLLGPFCFHPGGSWGRGRRWCSVCTAQPVARTHCCQLHLLLTQRPAGSFQTKILSDTAAATLPQWLFLAEACAPACGSALTHSTYFSRLHHSVRLNETLNYQTSKLGISKRDKWMSCTGTWLCNPTSAEHLLLGQVKLTGWETKRLHKACLLIGVRLCW